MHGQLSLNQIQLFPSQTLTWASANLGEILGLRGVASLAPLAWAGSMGSSGSVRACMSPDSRAWRPVTWGLGGVAGVAAVGVYLLMLAAPPTHLGNGLGELNQGVKACQAGQFEEGVASLREALVYHPDWIFAYDNLCACYNIQGQSERAIDACQHALAIDPADGPARGTAPSTRNAPSAKNNV